MSEEPTMTEHTQDNCQQVYDYEDLEYLPDIPDLETPYEQRMRCRVCGREWYQTD